MSILSKSGSALNIGKGPRIGGVAFSPPSMLFVGSGLVKGAKNWITEGTLLTNPLFYGNAHSGYGKRGMDADRMGAGGLVQGLHNKRRMR